MTDKRVALVTGAGSPQGIGFAVARALCEAGYCVALTSTTSRIEQRASELPGLATTKFAHVADLTQRDQVHKLVARVHQTWGRLDVLVNNAGMAQSGVSSCVDLFEHLAFEDWERAMNINLHSCFHVTQESLPLMLGVGYGRIVNIASVTGPLLTYPGQSAYAAAKSAMVGLTRSLALEVARRGITVNAIAPGWIDTPSATAFERKAAAATPVGRAGTPAEVAALAVFLASEQSSYLTGQMITLDGGNSIQENKGS